MNTFVFILEQDAEKLTKFGFFTMALGCAKVSHRISNIRQSSVVLPEAENMLEFVFKILPLFSVINCNRNPIKPMTEIKVLIDCLSMEFDCFVLNYFHSFNRYAYPMGSVTRAIVVKIISKGSDLKELKLYCN